MTIEEAKQKANKDDEIIKVLLDYISCLEDNYLKLKEINEEHRRQVGDLFKQLDRR